MKSTACALPASLRFNQALFATYRLAAITTLLLAGAAWFSTGNVAVDDGGGSGVAAWVASASLAGLVVWTKRCFGQGIPTRR